MGGRGRGGGEGERVLQACLVAHASVLCDVDSCIRYVHMYKPVHMNDVPCKLHGGRI